MGRLPTKNMKSIKTVDLPDDSGTVQLFFDHGEGHYLIHRYTARGKVNNYISHYEVIDSTGKSKVHKIDYERGMEIMFRIENGESYSGVFIFYDGVSDGDFAIPEKSEQEHRYTSTGIKFWRHQEQMLNYKNGEPGTVISTHISPEGTCNLKCPYCSVTYRDTHSRLEMDTIKNYVETLKRYGLKAVILTGGGEPLAYKHINELVRYLKSQDLSVALITNGTLTKRVDDDVWGMFDWIRVSINVFGKWVQSIHLPLDKIDFSKTTVGCSMVYTVEHEMSDEIMTDRAALLRKAAQVADQCGAEYVRLLPNCLLEQKDLIMQHRSLDHTLLELNDPRFFHQYKIHGAPQTAKCHQSHFRPYLSEEIHMGTGKPGAVYPCDSVVLNEGYEHFAEEYQLCHADDIAKYLEGEIAQRFDAKERCKGCVFTDNVNMLDDFKHGKVERFSDFPSPIKHEEFV